MRSFCVCDDLGCEFCRRVYSVSFYDRDTDSVGTYHGVRHPAQLVKYIVPAMESVGLEVLTIEKEC